MLKGECNALPFPQLSISNLKTILNPTFLRVPFENSNVGYKLEDRVIGIGGLVVHMLNF